MSDQISQCDNLISKCRSVKTPRWWIFAFIVSFVVFSSALLFLGGEAHAKSGDGGGGGGEKSTSDSGGGGNGGKSDGGGSGGSGKVADGGGSAKGGGGDGPIGGLTSGGADSAKGSEGPRGGGGPSKDISSGDGQRSKDIVGDATSSSPNDAKGDAGPLDRTTSSDASDDISGRLDDSRLSGDTAKATSPSNITDKDLVTNDSNTAIQPVKQTAEETLQPVKQTAEETLQPVKQTAEETLQPVKQTAEETLQPVKQTAEETLQPVVAPASEATEPTAARTVAEPIGASEPVVAPATDTLTTGATESALEPVGPVLDSLPAGGVDPLGSQQDLSSALVESSAYYQPAVTAALATEAASTSLDSDTVVAVVREGNLEGSTSNATANLSRSYPEQNGLSLLKEGLASLNLTGMQVALDQVPQPFPAGAMPMAVGGFSGGSSSSSSGGGLEAGILGLLAVLLMGGKFLWSTRDFLKPNTALLLAIERPG